MTAYDYNRTEAGGAEAAFVRLAAQVGARDQAPAVGLPVLPAAAGAGRFGAGGLSGVTRAMEVERLARRIEALVKAGHKDADGDMRMVAKVLVVNGAGQLLLLHDAKADRWDLPGGHLKEGESAAEGAVREVFEETGLSVSVFRGEARKVHYGKNEQAILVFEAMVGGKPCIRLSDEHDGFSWVIDPKDMPLDAYEDVVRDYLKPVTSKASEPVKAAEPDASGYATAPQSARESTLAHHRVIRMEAAHEYRKATDRVVAALEAQALAELKRKETAAKKRKRREEELEALALLLFLAGERIYRSTNRKLAALLGTTTALMPTTAPTGAPPAEPDQAVTGGGIVLLADAEEASAYASSRRPLLVNFPEEAAERLGKEAEAGVAAGEGESEVARRLSWIAKEIEDGQGNVVAETEATAVMGKAQLRLLQRAGYATCMWDQLDRPTKRESHELNMEEGEVPVGHTFSNGQKCPGDEVGGPEENINCFPADTLVEWPALRASMRRWYSGDMVKIGFAGGNSLTATPNHPVLRGDGAWVPIGELQEGDDCVGCKLVRHFFAKPDENSMPSKIGDVHSSAKVSGVTKRIRLAPPDFHGDATNGQVEIVTVKRDLSFNFQPASDQQIEQFGFALANEATSVFRGGNNCSVISIGTNDRNEVSGSSGRVCGESIEPVLLWSLSGVIQPVSLSNVALLDTSSVEAKDDYIATDAKLVSQGLNAFSGQVAAHKLGRVNRKFGHAFQRGSSVALSLSAEGNTGRGQNIADRLSVSSVFGSQGQEAFPGDVRLHNIISIERFHYDGFVFNLDTGLRYYTSNGIASQNCLCTLIGVKRKPGTGHLQASEPVQATAHDLNGGAE